jgi:hypothetical protein
MSNAHQIDLIFVVLYEIDNQQCHITCLNYAINIKKKSRANLPRSYKQFNNRGWFILQTDLGNNLL